MGIFSKLFGSRAPSGSPTPTPALTPVATSSDRLALPALGKPIELVPIPGVLTVRAHAHAMQDVDGPFVTIVTEGLRSRGQREILVTLRTRDVDDLASIIRDVANFFAFVYRLAGEGKIVRNGDFTQFGERGLLGGTNNGVLYVDANPISDIDLPPAPLAAIVVGPDEIALARASGPYRVLARLGEHYRTFPFPRWNDLHRSSVATGEQETTSVLAKMARARVSGSSVVAESGHLRMLVTPDGRPVLRKLLEPSAPSEPVALLTDPTPDANARLVWRPGQTEPTAITPPGSDGSRMTGIFLLVTGGVERDEVRLFEDGYALLLTPDSLASLWQALRDEQPFSLDRCEGMTFAVEWASLDSTSIN